MIIPKSKPWLQVTVDGSSLTHISSTLVGTATFLLTLSEPVQNIFDTEFESPIYGAPFHIVDYKLISNTITDSTTSELINPKSPYDFLGNFPHQPCSEVLTFKKIQSDFASGKYPTLGGNAVIIAFEDAGSLTNSPYSTNLEV